MRRKISSLIAILLLLIGIGLIAYPYVSDWYYKQILTSRVQNYEVQVEQQDDSAKKAELAEAQDYNARLADSGMTVGDPFASGSSGVTEDEYNNLLNTDGNGTMATLYIPKINAVLPIFHGTDDDTLENGVGHMSSSSLPVGGPSAHTVLAGHNGLPSVKIFDDIDKLEPGDYFVISVLGEDHAYRVTSKETVLPTETSSLVIQDGKDLCTLVTCVPYGVNTHRLLVHAERCDVPQDWLDRGKTSVITSSQQATQIPLIVFSLIGLGIALILILTARRARRKHEEAAAVEATPKNIESQQDGENTPESSNKSGSG